jgi:hypothetical protein
MTFSPETLALFAQLLDNVQLNAAAPDFEQVALQVIAARRELAAALKPKPEHNGRVTKSPRANPERTVS